MTTLNKSSAIATIIGTAIAAVTLTYQLIDRGDKSNSTSDPNTITPPFDSSKIATLEIPAKKATQNEEKAETSTVDVASTDPFDARIKAAMLINTYSTKDTVLIEISKQASDKGNFSSALRAADEISIYRNKDIALAYISHKALNIGKRDIALAAADKMTIYSNRDQALSEIATK